MQPRLRITGTESCYSKWGPDTSNSGNMWKPIRNAESWALLQSKMSKRLELKLKSWPLHPPHISCLTHTHPFTLPFSLKPSLTVLPWFIKSQSASMAPLPGFYHHRVSVIMYWFCWCLNLRAKWRGDGEAHLLCRRALVMWEASWQPLETENLSDKQVGPESEEHECRKGYSVPLGWGQPPLAG